MCTWISESAKAMLHRAASGVRRWLCVVLLGAAGAVAAQAAPDPPLQRLLGDTVGQAPADRMAVVAALQQLGQPARAAALRRYLLAAHVARLDGKPYDPSTTLAQATMLGEREAEPAPGTPMAAAWERAFHNNTALLYRFVNGERPPLEVQALTGPVQPWSPGLWGVGSADPWLYIVRLSVRNDTGAPWPVVPVDLRTGGWTLACSPAREQPPATVLRSGEERVYLCHAAGGQDLRKALQDELARLYMGSQGTRPPTLQRVPTDFRSAASVALWVAAVGSGREAEAQALVRGVQTQRQQAVAEAERARLDALARAKEWKQQALAWGFAGAALWLLQGCLRGWREGVPWGQLLVPVGLPAAAVLAMATLVGTSWGLWVFTWAGQQWGTHVSPWFVQSGGSTAGTGKSLNQRPALLFVLLTLAVYAIGRALYAIGTPGLLVKAATLASMVGVGTVLLGSFGGLSDLTGSLPGLAAAMVIVMAVMAACLGAGLMAIRLHTLHDTLAGVGSGLARNFMGAFRRSLDFRSVATAAELWAYLVVYFAATLVALDIATPLGWATAALLGVPAVALVVRRVRVLSTLEVLFIAAGVLIIAFNIAHGL